MHRASRLDQSGETYKLYDLIHSNELIFSMEVHDALTAAISARTEFRGLWASGRSISSRPEFRDTNEIPRGENFRGHLSQSQLLRSRRRACRPMCVVISQFSVGAPVLRGAP